MTKKIVAYQINGKPAYKDIDIPDELITQNWHVVEKNARVCFSLEFYNENLKKLLAHNLGLESHPFLAALASAVQSGSFIRVEADGMVYYYCEYVDDVDEAIIIDYKGYVEPKP